MKILAKLSIMTRNMFFYFCTKRQRAQRLTGKLKPEVVGLSPLQARDSNMGVLRWQCV